MKVSVGIITKDRVFDLQHCLGSLSCQLVCLDELVIISSSEKDLAVEGRLIAAFAKKVSFKVKLVKEKRKGFPYAYNTGINQTTHDWVVFIDDDCVADIDWYQEIKQGVGQYPQASALLGASRTYYQDNIFSLSRHFINELGKVQTIKRNIITDLEILDAKNVVYNKRFLFSHNILCDVSLVKYGVGASQDCDLGMQIQQVGGKARYIPKTVVIHKDPVTLVDYYRKLYWAMKHHLVYEDKWCQYRLNNIKTQRVNFKLVYNYFNKYRKINRLDLFQSLLLLVNIFVSYVVVFLIRKMALSQK